MISHKHKCIFVHIPKCGGTSIEDILWPEPRQTSDLWMGFIDKYSNKYQTGGLQHLFAANIRKEVGNAIYDEFFKFSFTRNPWDKAISQYTYTLMRRDLMDYIGLKKHSSFKKYLELIRKKSHAQWEPQYKFVTDYNGDIIVDYIGRLENFNDDVQFVLSKLGLTTVTIPHSKKSSHKHYAKYYDDESKAIVADLYCKDIELFDYSFQ